MKTVLLERKKGISYITLNRPDTYNALNADLLEELLTAVKEIESNDDPVLIISGQGQAFSAGGDVKMLQQDFSDEGLYDDVMDTIESVMLHLFNMSKVVISAVDGPAAGLGFSLALAADYIISSTESRFGMLFLGVGLVPDGGGHFWLSERIGSHAAQKLIWSMDQVAAPEAKDMGLIDIVSDKPVVQRAEQLAGHCFKAPLEAMLQTKHIYREQQTDDLKYYLQKEREAQRQLRQTANHQEGVNAFLEKRAPVFNHNN